MPYFPDRPLALLFPAAFLLLWLSARFGAWFGRRRPLDENSRREFDVMRAAALTLLGLIIGFSFSMAINRYDLRKELEQAENNAISTQYLRADLLPETSAAKTRTLLKQYLDLRIRTYRTRNEEQMSKLQATTTQTGMELWSLLPPAAATQPTPPMALLIAGMNAVLDAAADSNAARLNRIPRAAWDLMMLIAVCCCILIGIGTPDDRRARSLLPILPLIVAISLLLIADIDTPWGGLIRVQPENLQGLAGQLRAQ